MADLRTYECTMCRVKCRLPEEMAVHVLREKEHRKMLAFYNPKGVKELGRLQYFLDTHMKEEPILGLEYIVEEQLEPEKYRYTCQLCHLGGDAYTIFRHILKEKHTVGYIAKHHPSLSVKLSENPNKTNYLRELRARALAIQNDHRHKEIQSKQSAANSPVEQEQPPPRLVIPRNCPVDEQAIPSLEAQRGLRKCPIYKEAPPPPDGPQGWRWCLVCNVCSSSVICLCNHILGNSHRKMLMKVAYKEVKNLDSMQYILDTYIKQDAVLGLEYVVEWQVSGSYWYACSLCDVEDDLSHSLIHVVGEDHMVRYIGKHHGMMLPNRLPNKMEYVRELREIALTIQSTYGRKNIQTADSFVSFPSPPEDIIEESGPFLHDGEGFDNFCPCRLCNAVFFSPVDLWKHVVGSKHKKILSKTSPKDLKELGRLQYFLNKHMKEYPLLGLKYVVEEQLDSTSYKYTCQLCNVEGYLPQMITHITCAEHVERYIDKDHSELSLRVYTGTYPERADYIKALTKIAIIILEKYGRQDIVQY